MKKKKKIIIILTVIMLFSVGIVFGAINGGYDTNDTSIDITESTIKNNLVLDYIGQFIFSLGNIFQKVTSSIIGVATGKSVFPWVDKVVFNTVPLLDVNFLNPDSKSLLSLDNPIGLGEIVRNMYFTCLSIGIGFLSIIVAIMAIRMAISTIASEKAKFKESIVSFATSLVLLFGLHFLISFLFYTNEQMVVVASKILKTSVKESSAQVSEIINKDLNEKKKKIVDNFIKNAGSHLEDDDKKLLEDNYKITYMLLNNETYREALDYIDGNDKTNIVDHLGKFGSGLLEFVSFGNYNSPADQQAALLAFSVNEIVSTKDTKSHQDQLVENSMNSFRNISDMEKAKKTAAVAYLNAYDITVNSTAKDENGLIPTSAYIQTIIDNGGPDISNYSMSQLDSFAQDSYEKSYDKYRSKDRIEENINLIKNDLSGLHTKEYENALLLTLNYAEQAFDGTLNVDGSNDNVISNLGEYFKQTAWSIDVDKDGWAPTESSIVSAILYTLLVLESIGFFIAYVKRFFMVMVLSILGPIVVIYDFFTKATYGAKKGIFGTWLRELCTLIFVQTFHAFLIAIILSLIVKVIAGSYASTIDGSIEAVGLLCIFALITLPKLELLIKNMFGLTSGVADTSFARHANAGIVGSLFALRAGKRVLDNGGKIVGGLGKAIKGQAKVRMARNNRNEAAIAARRRENALLSESGSDNSSNGGGSQGGLNPGNDNGELTRSIKQLTSELRKQNENNDSNSDKDNLKNLEQAIKDAKKERNEGLSAMFSGTLETLGAAHGAVAGAVVAAGTNNNIANYAVSGAGVGDAIGEKAAKTVTSAPAAVSGIKDALQAEMKAHTGATKEAYQQIEKELKEEAKKNSEEMKKDLYEYAKKNVGKSSSNSSSRKLPDKKKIDVDAGNM